jgi:hypothetical protein
MREVVDGLKRSPCQDCGGTGDPDHMGFYRSGSGHRSIRWLISHAAGRERIMEAVDSSVLLCRSRVSGK